MSDRDHPTLPPDRLGDSGWTLAETVHETVFRGLGVSVTGHTAVYEDLDLRDRIVAAGGEDRTWRFLFAARLEIGPPPGAAMASVARPYVVRQCRQNAKRSDCKREIFDFPQ